MRVRLQTLFLVTTWLAVTFAVLGPRLAKWWGAKPTQVPDDSQAILLKPPYEGVVSLAFSGDGEYLASAHGFLESAGNRSSRAGISPAFVMLWDVREEGNLARFQINEGSYQQVQFARDGKLVINSRGQIMFWDIQEQVLRRTAIENVSAMSPGGNFAVSGDEPTTHTDIRTVERGIVARLSTDKDAEAWAISPDSTLVAIGHSWPGERKRIEIWNVTEGKIQATLPSSIGSRMCASFSPDGKLFACASLDGKEASVFDTETGKLRGKFGPLRGPVWCLAFSPSGKTLAVGGEVGEVHWWDVATGGHHDQNGFGSNWGVTAVAFSPDGTRLAIGDGDGNIKLIPIAE